MEFFFEFLLYLKTLINEYYLLSLIIFSLYLFLHSIISLPGIIILWIFSGYAFGIYMGYIISIIFTVFGSFILFILSKTIFHKYFRKYFNNQNQMVENTIKENSYEILILFRMIPINVPFFIQNVGISFLKISSKKYLITTFIGFTPLTFMCSLIGDAIIIFDDIKNVNIKDIISYNFLIIIGIIIFLLFLRIYYKNKKEKK